MKVVLAVEARAVVERTNSRKALKKLAQAMETIQIQSCRARLLRRRIR